MEVREIEGAPGLAPLYAKAVVTSLPLPLIGGGDGELPDNGLTLPDVEVDREHLAGYCHVCGFRLSDQLPVTYPQVLSFPLAMRLMTDREFPFPLLGLVHIVNRIEQRRPVGTDEPLTLAVRAENLRPHDKGRQVDLVTDVLVDGEQVLTGTATYLHRGGGSSEGANDERADEGSSASGSGGSGDGKPGEVPEQELRRAATWKVPGHIGRAYAAVSGDRNPIHMHSLTARLFGFPSAIAHGMWMKARCLAAFEGRLPDALETEVAFKKPMLLPARVHFSTGRSPGGGHAFALHDARKGAHHLTGWVRPLG
jgi:acyl dehydratase